LVFLRLSCQSPFVWLFLITMPKPICKPLLWLCLWLSCSATISFLCHVSSLYVLQICVPLSLSFRICIIVLSL
jgi:hypothetical protein